MIVVIITGILFINPYLNSLLPFLIQGLNVIHIF